MQGHKENNAMKTHSKTITKPRRADSGAVDRSLFKLDFANNILVQIDSFLAESPKTQASA